MCAILFGFALLLLFLFVFFLGYTRTVGESDMGPAPVLFYFHFYFYFSAANPSRCFSLCLLTSFFYLISLLSPFPSPFIFISLCDALVVLVLVFLSGLSCTAHMDGSLSYPTRITCIRGCPLFISLLFVFCLSFVSWFSLLNLFLATMSFAGYFHARFLLSAFFLVCLLCFVFLRPCSFPVCFGITSSIV